MARKTKAKFEERKKIAFKDSNLKFVLNNLDSGQLEELDTFEENPPNLADFLTACVDNGLDVKVSYDTYSKGYQASAIGSWQNYPSADCGASAFSRSSADDALFVLWYKVEVISQYDLSQHAGREKITKERG
jgi:hypothetical protein